MIPASDPARPLDRFALLASGIAGRTLQVAPAAPGDLPWTDTATVFVDPTASARDQISALAVQAALIAADSLEPGTVRRLTGRPALARRYLAAEGHRVLASTEDLLPRPVRTLIDHDAAARTDSPGASLALALGREPLGEPPPVFGVIRPKRLLASRDRAAAAPSPDDASGRRRYGAPDEPGEDAGSDDGGPAMPFFSSPGSGRGALAWLFKRLLSLRRDGSSGPMGAGAQVMARRTPETSRRAAAATRPAGALTAMATAERRGTAYPEWDVHRRRYRPDWCTVQEADPRPEDGAALTAPGGSALRRPLARLGLGIDRCRRQLTGDDVDIDAAVEARIDALAGTPRDRAVYIDSLRRRRDLAVLVLLDISGSAAEPGDGGKTVHQQQRTAAAMLTATLHSLGDRVALYGFRSCGRSAVRLVRVKSFGDDLDALVLRRLGGLVPGMYTRLGAAIRHGASILETRGGTSRRLLVVLSDGLAYDHGYEGPYGEADSRRALAEARRRGTGCLCLSVGAGADLASLRRVFGTAAHASVTKPEQLGGVIGPLFRAALASAEHRRRMSQREARAHQPPGERRTA